MNKDTPFNVLLRKAKEFYNNISMSTQLILTIGLIFISFFALQWLLNNQFFDAYYTNQEFSNVNTSISNYVDSMNRDTADLYDEMYQFTANKNIYSIVVSRDYRIQSSGYNDYIFVVEETGTSEQYTFLVPDNFHNYAVGENVSIEAYTFKQDLYSPITIDIEDQYTYDNGIFCEGDECIDITGTIIEVYKPVNLNYQFENQSIVLQELYKLSSGTIELEVHDYEDGWWYPSSNDHQDYLVFINELGSFDFIITIVPIENTSNIIAIVSTFNNWIYITAILIVFVWSFRLSRIISTPVKKIEGVAFEIANLNFNVEAHEYNNKENISLSNSINLIAKNLKETLDTLSTKNDELSELYDEQIKQVTLKKQLVSSISHELKTPLMIMQVTIQGILDGIIDEKDQAEELNNVIDEINKSSIMIADMLQIYRLEDANTTLELSEFRLSDTVKFFVKDFENILKKHKLNIELNLDEDLIVEADNKLLKRVISNFITNAIRYTPDKGNIYIEVSQQQDKVYFELTNFGINIDEEELEHIWIPFYRGQKSAQNQKLKTKGSGIGLYLVSEILKAHNANYDICNVENGVKAYFIMDQRMKL
jgi:signal transduction histidine kinase